MTSTEQETLFNKLEHLKDLSIISIASQTNKRIPMEFLENSDHYIVNLQLKLEEFQHVNVFTKHQMLQIFISDENQNLVQQFQDIIHVLDVDEDSISTTVSTHNVSLTLPKLNTDLEVG